MAVLFVLILVCCGTCVRCFLVSDPNRLVPIKNYSSFISQLRGGADVRYFFNTTVCQTMGSTEREPVFGGKVQLFGTGQMGGGITIISQQRYSDDDPKKFNDEIQSLWINKEIIQVLIGQPGFFINKTDTFTVATCTWNEGSIWVKKSPQQQLKSFTEIQNMLYSGEEVGWVAMANVVGCSRPSSSMLMSDAFGDTIKDFKVQEDGSISFSSSMISMVPLSWRYVRFLFFGHIYPDNTANFTITDLEPTTLEVGDIYKISCSIATTSRSDGAVFYINGP